MLDPPTAVGLDSQRRSDDAEEAAPMLRGRLSTDAGLGGVPSVGAGGGSASLALVDLKTKGLETSIPSAARESVALTKSFSRARCGTLCDLMPLALRTELAGEVLPEAMRCSTTVVRDFAIVWRIAGGKLGVLCAAA